SPGASKVTRRGPGVAIRAAIIGASLALYLGSLATPALEFVKTSGEQQVLKGYEALLLGWQALFVGNVGWLANVMDFPSLILLLPGFVRTAAVVSALAAAVGLHTLMLMGVTLSADEAGVTHMSLTRLDVGFYLWIASMGLVMIGSIGCWRASK